MKISFKKNIQKKMEFCLQDPQKGMHMQTQTYQSFQNKILQNNYEKKSWNRHDP